MNADQAATQVCDAALSNNLAECKRVVEAAGTQVITAPCPARNMDTALHYAALDNSQVLEWFLQQSIDPNTLNSHGRTALMVAACYGSLPCTRALLAAGATTTTRGPVRSLSSQPCVPTDKLTDMRTDRQTD
eukprot:m.76270 g.76270  ORF g.76270 m.76270 type:complete len:132 (-) comp50447_c0_seq6:8-403(-)